MDYLIPADVIAAAAEAMEDEAVRCLGRDLGTVHRDDIAAAALGAALAAGLVAAPAPTVDAIERIRQIIADHCFGPHVDSVAELRALEIAAACTDDMVDEGLLAASHASPAAPADDEATKNAVLKLADTIAFEAYRAWAASSNRDAYVDVAIRNAAKSVALAALREGQ